ncbi:MAG: S1C family serine protease, partial [Dehalococcoidia bacterium]
MIRQSGARSLVFLVLVLALALTGCLRGSEEPTPAATGTAQPSTPAAVGSLNVFPSVADMVQEAIPAVVSIVSGSVELNLFLELVPQREGAGSGIIYNSQGFIVTNDHVIVNADSIHVTLSDGRSFDAVAVGRDPLTDLAVIKIEGNNFPFLAFGDPNQIRVGDPVIAIGHALALEGGPTVTAGVVSGLERTVRLSTRQLLEDLIQTDASIHPGN